MRAEDVYQLTGVSDPRLRPGGEEVAYVVWAIDGDENDVPPVDLARAHGRLGAAAPVHDRQERRAAALVSGRRPPRIRLEARRRREGAPPALRAAGRRRRAGVPHRPEGGRRRAGLVAGRDPNRLLGARAGRGVRRGGREEARAAAVHAAPVQARQRRLDGRPAASPLRRPGRRLERGEADHRRRLRGLAPDVDARRQEHRVHLRPRRGLGHRA